MIAYLGLGSNLGNRQRNLQAGLRWQWPAARVVAVSSLYESEPVGQAGQQPYWNAAACIETDLAPNELLHLMKRVEWQMGRRPGRVWDSRPLDLDILLIESQRVELLDLTVPHPLLAERSFVLFPLAEIAAGLVHPLLGRTIAELRGAIPAEGVRRISGPEWLDG